MEILRGGNFCVFHDYGLIGEIFPMRKYHPNDIDTEIASKKWKLHSHETMNIFSKFSPSKNNHVYSNREPLLSPIVDFM